METVDDETVAAAIDFIKRQNTAGSPWFVWWSGTRMHFRTHVKAEHRGISGQDECSDGMVEHDMHIGQFLDLLDELSLGRATRDLLLESSPADSSLDDRSGRARKDGCVLGRVAFEAVARRISPWAQRRDASSHVQGRSSSA